MEKLLKTHHRRPVTFKVLCAIARMVLLKSPSASDAEWKASVLETCAKQGWDNPEGDMLARALGAVERSLQATTGLFRPSVVPGRKETPKPDRSWTEADYRALAETLKGIAARSAAVLPSAPVEPAERLEISEPAALDQFYAEAQTDRMAALRRFVEIAIVRPADWDFVSERAQKRRVLAFECFGCRAERRDYHRHHVIQIQHGGSNYIRNIVALCEACHSDVHPWLPKVERRAGGFTHIGDIGRLAVVALERMKKSEAS